jgi:hypothetical protein
MLKNASKISCCTKSLIGGFKLTLKDFFMNYKVDPVDGIVGLKAAASVELT